MNNENESDENQTKTMNNERLYRKLLYAAGPSIPELSISNDNSSSDLQAEIYTMR